MPDWISLPEDVVIELFSLLNYSDQASLSSTCRTFRATGKSPILWKALDLRSHKCDAATTSLLASWCTNLQKLMFQSVESAEAITHLHAKKLCDISGCCNRMTDAAISMLVAQHNALKRLLVDSGSSGRITSYSLNACAMFCPQLKKLWLSGIRHVDADAINALAENCKSLMDIGFIDCWSVDVTALGNIASLRFCSVAGTTLVNWDIAVQQWSKLPQLIGLDVSRTYIDPNNILYLFSSSRSLKVLCALSCPVIEENRAIVFSNSHRGKVLLAVFTDILKGVAKLFVYSSENCTNVFLQCRNSKDKKLDQMFKWLEWVISFSLLRFSKSRSPGLGAFWLDKGITLLLSFIQSTQDEVQEWATTALRKIIVMTNSDINHERAEAIVRDHGLLILLNLVQSLHEKIQSESTAVISALLLNPKAVKSLIEEGGITILSNLIQTSYDRFVVINTALALWNLSVVKENGAITNAGGAKALVDLIHKWSGRAGSERALELAAGTLANLAADDTCCIEVILVGGVGALVMLARHCNVEKVQEKVARGLKNLTCYDDLNGNNNAVAQEAGAIDVLMELVHSPHDGIRIEAADALWNLACDDENLEVMATAGVIQAMVALVHPSSGASSSVQMGAARLLWGFSDLKRYRIAIVQEGAIAPLIALAQYEDTSVAEVAVGALWNIAFCPENALRIAHDGGLPVLAHICSSSTSRYAQFLSSIVLTYMFDGRVDKIASADEPSNLRISTDSRTFALKHMEEFILSFYDAAAFSSAIASSVALAHLRASICIPDVGPMACSGAEIGRFATMLRNPCPTLKLCATFALLQFSIGGSIHAPNHVKLMQNAGVSLLLRGPAAAAGTAPRLRAIGKVFARIVLRNLDTE